jgi:hypothetical protein
MTNRKMIDYRVRIQVAEDSPDGVLLDFLKHERHPSFSHKEMVLWALRGYWMAIAFRHQRELGDESMSEAQMQRLALDAIHQLKQQITYIQTTFGMEQIWDEDLFAPGGSSSHKLPCYRVTDGAPESRADPPSSRKLARTKQSVVDGAIASAVNFQVGHGDWYEGDDLFDSRV